MFHKLRNNIDKILINIVSLHMIRSVYYRIISCYSDDECYRTFVDEMNADSKRMGLTNSFWANASGLLDNEREAYTTANDVAKLGVIAYRQGKINPFWNLKYYTCTIQKPYILSINNIKTIRVISTIPYEYIGGKYKILGASYASGGVRREA